MRSRTALCIAILIAALLPTAKVTGGVQDDLAQRSSWSLPEAQVVQQRLDEWFRTVPVEPAAQEQFQALWAEQGPASPDRLLARLVRSVALVDPRAEELLDTCHRPPASTQLSEPPILTDETLPAWIRQNLCLYYAQWLTGQQFYNEAQVLLDQLRPEQVCDPAALMFYQAVVYHRLLEKDKCLTTLNRLLENEAGVPQRYVKLARLMQADLEPLEPDSLDEIARLMESIKVRLGHGRAGTRVRQEEDDVIAKLDKMIEELEQQANNAAASANAAGNNAPNQPVSDSMAGGQSGPGNVDPKKLGLPSDWGNLPPKEREEALQQARKRPAVALSRRDRGVFPQAGPRRRPAMTVGAGGWHVGRGHSQSPAPRGPAGSDDLQRLIARGRR